MRVREQQIEAVRLSCDVPLIRWVEIVVHVSPNQWVIYLGYHVLHLESVAGETRSRPCACGTSSDLEEQGAVQSIYPKMSFQAVGFTSRLTVKQLTLSDNSACCISASLAFRFFASRSRSFPSRDRFSSSIWCSSAACCVSSTDVIQRKQRRVEAPRVKT